MRASFFKSCIGGAVPRKNSGRAEGGRQIIHFRQKRLVDVEVAFAFIVTMQIEEDNLVRECLTQKFELSTALPSGTGPSMAGKDDVSKFSRRGNERLKFVLEKNSKRPIC